MIRATFLFLLKLLRNHPPSAESDQRFREDKKAAAATMRDRLLACVVLVATVWMIGCQTTTEPPPDEPLPDPDPDPIPLHVWTKISFPSEETIQAILADESGLVFVGTWGDGLLRSTDFGLTWTTLAEEVSDDILSITRASDGGVLIGTHRGIFRSTDRGNTWLLTQPTTGLVRCVCSGANGEVLAVATHVGVFRSTDNGLSWTEVTGAPDDRYLSAIISPGGNLFVGTNTGLYRSTDAGTSWDHSISAGGISYNMALGIDGTIFAPTWARLHKSTDEGSTWTLGGESPSIGAIQVGTTGLIFLGTNEDGILMSNTNGDSWWDISSGLSSREIRSLAIDPEGYVYAGTWIGGGLFKTVEPIAQ